MPGRGTETAAAHQNRGRRDRPRGHQPAGNERGLGEPRGAGAAQRERSPPPGAGAESGPVGPGQRGGPGGSAGSAAALAGQEGRAGPGRAALTGLVSHIGSRHLASATPLPAQLGPPRKQRRRRQGVAAEARRAAGGHFVFKGAAPRVGQRGPPPGRPLPWRPPSVPRPSRGPAVSSDPPVPRRLRASPYRQRGGECQGLRGKTPGWGGGAAGPRLPCP